MLGNSQTILPLLLASTASFAIAWPALGRAADYRISGPHSHENLSIFLLHGHSADGPVPLTLEEALDKGAVKVHETGTVGELEIENLGAEGVLVHAGDIVKGGWQDRVVGATMIMKPKSGRLPVSVFCVESGRWSGRGAEDAEVFASAKAMMPSREAKLAMKARRDVGAVPPTASEPSAAGPIREPENELGTAGSAQEPDQRSGPARDPRRAPERPVNPQAEVWRSVSEIQAALSGRLGSSVASATSETSLQLALENEKLAEAQKRYLVALEAAGETESDVVGYVFAINGKINSADIYASNALFRKLWPRLLKAAATEAIGVEKALPKTLEPTVAAVEEFLAAASAGKPSERPLIDGQRLETREADRVVDFVTLTASGDFVHRNVLARH